jgi:deoxycytidylate deaminase
MVYAAKVDIRYFYKKGGVKINIKETARTYGQAEKEAAVGPVQLSIVKWMWMWIRLVKGKHQPASEMELCRKIDRLSVSVAERLEHEINTDNSGVFVALLPVCTCSRKNIKHGLRVTIVVYTTKQRAALGTNSS